MRHNKKQERALYLRVGALGVFVLLFVSLVVFAFYRASIQPRAGVVIRKDYTPAYTTTDYSYVHKSGESIRVPMQEYHPERYIITIKGTNTKGEEDTGIYDVTPDEYHAIKIGDYYIRESSH